MNLIKRNNDVITAENDLELLYKFDSFPVFMGCMNQSIEEDLHTDMQWNISKHSGSIQLNQLLPLEVLYPETHGSGCVGGLWMQHHQEFSKFIAEHAPKSVLEIGGAHGILSKEYHKKKDIDWTILEPNPSPVEGVKAKFIKGFFDDKFSFEGEIDTIIHSHVFEHVYYPDEFIRDIASFLQNGQKLIFSLPNMEEMLKRKYTNCINFEHTVFLTEPYVEHLLSKHGFRQIGKKYFLDDHSIFYAYKKDEDTEMLNLPDNLYEHNKDLYLDYVRYHEELIKELNERIADTDEKQPIYLFGAHVFAQYLICFGLNTDRITCLLDNDKNKHGKRLYGTNLMVESPEVLSQVEEPAIILKAGVYNDEIRDDIIGNINSSTIFLE